MKRQTTYGHIRQTPPPQVRMNEKDAVFCPVCRILLIDARLGIRKCEHCGGKMDVLPAASLRSSEINRHSEVSCPACPASYITRVAKEIKCSQCGLRFMAVKPSAQSAHQRVKIDRNGFVNCCACGKLHYAGYPRAMGCNCGVKLEAVWSL